MTNKLALSAALGLSIAIITLTGTTTTNAQAGGSMQPVADTGLVHLERDEIMIVSVSSKRGNNPIHLQFEESSFSSAGPGGGPHVKISERVAVGDIDGDGAFSFVFQNTGSVATSARVQVSCDRAPRCVVSASIHKIVITGGGERKHDYVGHVTLIK